MNNKQTLFLSLASALFLCGNTSVASEISTNTAQMQAMDKITGRVSVINVPVNSEVKFGSFSIVVRDCKTRSPEETPENFAFVDVVDILGETEKVNIFKGWMLSSSQALNAIEHPVYDVWLLKCIDTDISKADILSKEELIERDGLPKQKPESYRTKKNKKGYDFVDENLNGQPIDLLPASIRAAGEEAAAQEEVLPINPVQEINKIENEADFAQEAPITQSLADAIAAETAILEKAKQTETKDNNQSVEQIDENMVLPDEDEELVKIDVSEDNWEELPHLTEGDNGEKLDAQSQIQVLDNAWHEEEPKTAVVEENQETLMMQDNVSFSSQEEIQEETVNFPTKTLGEEVLEEKTLPEMPNIDIRDAFPLQPEIIINENIAQEKTQGEEPEITEVKVSEEVSLIETKEEESEPVEEDNSQKEIIEIDADILSDLEEELEQTKAN